MNFQTTIEVRGDEYDVEVEITDSSPGCPETRHDPGESPWVEFDVYFLEARGTRGIVVSEDFLKPHVDDIYDEALEYISEHEEGQRMEAEEQRAFEMAHQHDARRDR